MSLYALPFITECTPMPASPAEAPRRHPAPALERLVNRLAREVDAHQGSASIPEAEVRALLSLLEEQARAALEEVRHG